MSFLTGFVAGMLCMLIMFIAFMAGAFFLATRGLDKDGNKDLQSD